MSTNLVEGKKGNDKTLKIMTGNRKEKLVWHKWNIHGFVVSDLNK